MSARQLGLSNQRSVETIFYEPGIVYSHQSFVAFHYNDKYLSSAFC